MYIVDFFALQYMSIRFLAQVQHRSVWFLAQAKS